MYNFSFYFYFFIRDNGFHVYKYANLSLSLTFILQPIIFITSIIYAFWIDLIIIMVHLKFAYFVKTKIFFAESTVDKGKN